MLDSNKTLYKMGDPQGTTLDFEGYGLSWDGIGFWTRNNGSNGYGAQIVRIHPNSTIVDPGPKIFAQVGTSLIGKRLQSLADSGGTPAIPASSRGRAPSSSTPHFLATSRGPVADRRLSLPYQILVLLVPENATERQGKELSLHI